MASKEVDYEMLFCMLRGTVYEWQNPPPVLTNATGKITEVLANCADELASIVRDYDPEGE